MIDVIFTVDYEIYGDGTGSLQTLVHEPGEELRRLFHKWKAPLVNFVEVAELEMIERHGSDNAIDAVRQQIRAYHREGFEIALHLHPQWYNARFLGGQWQLDASEYNLCVLAPRRISEIIGRALHYLGSVVEDSNFRPVSFRAGNWLFQPTAAAAAVLAEHGIQIDSSVFKGGRQHGYGLDYRPALRNGYCWRFQSDVNVPDLSGRLIEVPIYSHMVAPWKMRTSKRMQFANTFGMAKKAQGKKWNRMRDFLRFRYPLKLDYCRMTLDELTSMMRQVMRRDAADPAEYRPIVAIGHTKDLCDPATVDGFLAFLRAQGIPIRTFRDAYANLSRATAPAQSGSKMPREIAVLN